MNKKKASEILFWIDMTIMYEQRLSWIVIREINDVNYDDFEKVSLLS